MFDSTCPQCGRDDRVRGTASDDGVRLTCSRCDHSWMRGERRCASCGGAESIARPQKLVVNPRGNQLSTVGLSEVLLCPKCDAKILTDTGPGQWLPDGYVSRFINGTRPEPAAAPRRRTASAPTEPAPRAPRNTARAATPAAAPSPRPALTDPTVREAVDASLAEVDGLNPGVLTLLAMRLGPVSRLSTLGDALSEDRLRAWAKDARLPSQADRTLKQLVAHWRSKGWI